MLGAMRFNHSNMSSLIPYSFHRSDRPPCSRPLRRFCLSRLLTAFFAAVSLLLASAVWYSLVFSPATSRCWILLRDWKGGHIWKRRSQQPPSPSLPNLSIFNQEDILHPGNRTLYSGNHDLSLKHILFGIAGSSQLWKDRKEFVKLWWRPSQMRGHVWFDDDALPEENNDFLPPIIVSEDYSHFRYTNPTGHPSGLRISRIVIESFRLDLPDVRWFVLGDDDTIFNADNLVAVLSKYDPSEMVYVGSPSESHSSNVYFSHGMAFGGGGIAISYPLAEALSHTHDDCIQRYPKLYGSDDRLHASIMELGVPLSREPGFHQWDIKGNAHGLLSTHPVAPFVSIHHVEAVNPLYPGLSTLDSLKLFTRTMALDPMSFLQRSVCYDHANHLTFSVSLGYVVQVFPDIRPLRELERAELTFSAWNGIRHPNEFDVDMRMPVSSICKKPILFFLKEARREGDDTLGTYTRASMDDDVKRKVQCSPHSLLPLKVESIEVLGYPLKKNWHLAPRRLCCRPTQAHNEPLRLTVGQCGSLHSGSLASSR